jgi:TolB protein
LQGHVPTLTCKEAALPSSPARKAIPCIAAALVLALLLASFFAAAAVARPASCRHGQIVFSRSSTTGAIRDIYSMDPCGGALRRLTFNGGDFPELSPDGTSIAFAGPGPNAMTFDLWIMRTDGSELRELTNTPDRNEAFPAWSPDGRKLAFSAEPPGSDAGQLFVMDLRTGVERALTQPYQPREAADASWSPDGRQIVFDEFAQPPALGQLWMIRADGTGLHPITPTALDAFAPDWGPNGLIALSSGASSPQSHIWIMRADGHRLRQITADSDGASSEFPAFSPRGNRLTYLHILASGAQSIWRMRLNGQDQTPLTTGPNDAYPDWGR